MIEIDIVCNGCRATLGDRDEVHCAACMKAIEECEREARADRDKSDERVLELEEENTELQKELAIEQAQRETEAAVFAKQIREKDVLIHELLAKVHAA